MAKVNNSRTARWNSAVENAKEKLEKLQDSQDEFNEKIVELRDKVDGDLQEFRDAMQELRDVQEEYQEWFDNLPESLQYNSPVSDKLTEVINLDLDEGLEDIEEMELNLGLVGVEDQLNEAEGADLPLGFGRD